MANRTKKVPHKIVAMYEGGMSMRQIAEATGLNISLIHSRLHYWKARIREAGGVKNARLGLIKQIAQRMSEK